VQYRRMSDGYGDEEAGEEVENLANARTPTSLRAMRACKRCGMLKGIDQFIEEGCENCPFLAMRDDIDRCNRCTTAFFEGQAAVMDPRKSWVAKWLRVDAYLPGVYAISVTGQFDQEIEDKLVNMSCRWRCRPATS